MGWVPEYSYYRDSYGGVLGVETYGEALPAAVRQVKWLVGAGRIRQVIADTDTAQMMTTACGCPVEPPMSDELDALRRAVCAAVDCIGEWGTGQVGGFELGSFSVTHYDNRGTTGVEQATEAILKELAGTGLTFIGAGR